MSEHDELDHLDGIAIIGLACRFPGARDAAAFWSNLRQGVESIPTFSDEELEAAAVPPELYRRPDYVRAGGVLDDVELFDAAVFGFTPREAELLDPQHRLFLECTAAALDDAGYDPQRFDGRIALFGGTGADAYLYNNLLANRRLLEEVGKMQVMLLAGGDFLCTRTSYKLDLRGPSAQVQTACSTGLVAVHMGCQSLLTGECEMALGGAVSLALPQTQGYLYTPGGILSADGHCRAFDAEATGAVAGSGVGLVVLKRMADAVADGDTIRAVIRGSAVNNDGSTKVGFTAPSVTCQAEVIAEALSMAGVEPAEVSMLEAHGSGTALGDQIELEALHEAFRDAGRRRFCALGSVKTNVGHLNAAAGIAGLIKAVLAVEHGAIPPSLNFRRPHPEVDLEHSPFFVNTELRPWGDEGAPRRAGVSSFGIGGTNVHVVLEEAPPPPPPAPSRPHQLLVLSGRTPGALEAACRRLAEHLEARPELPLADVAHTLQVGRRRFRHRRALVAADTPGAAAALRRVVEGAAGAGSAEGGRLEALTAQGEAPEGARPLVFLFPGLGDHYPGMARELYAAEPVFRREVDRAAEILTQELGVDLRQLAFAGEAPAQVQGPDLRALLRRGGGGGDHHELDRTVHAQPALFMVEHALGRLLMEWGLAPRAMMGYSLGEYVAATLAGVLTLEDALRLVAGRAKLIEALPGGAMLAVPLPEGEVAPLLEGGLELVATNGPNLSVVGGPEEEVAALEGQLGDEVACLRLTTTHAFHTGMMQPAVAALDELARSVALSPPRIPYLSNVTGTWITEAEATDPTYFSRHMTSTVRFAEGLGELLADPERVLVEVGPGNTLTSLARQHPDATAEHVAVATVRHASEGASDQATLLRAVGRLWTAGAEPDWGRFLDGEERRRLPLPPYPFEGRRFWVEPSPAPAAGPEAAATAPAAKAPDLADWFYTPGWRQLPPAELAALRAGTGAAAAAGTGGDEGEGEGGGEERAGERWLVFADDWGLGQALAERVAERGGGGETPRVLTVRPGEGFAVDGGAATLDPADPGAYPQLLAELEPHGGPLHILHLWGVTAEEAELVPESFERAQQRGLVSILCLVQALVAAGAVDGSRLTVVANRLCDVLGEEAVEPAKATVLGACRVLPQEHPGLVVRAVDVELPAPAATGESEAGTSAARERLLDRLLAEAAAGDGPRVVAYRGTRRWGEAHEPVRLSGARAPRLAAGGAHLVTDASQDLGLALAETLLRETGGKLALVLPPGTAEEGEGAPEGLAAVREAAEEAGGEVAVLRGDAADGEDLARVLAEAAERFGPLQGIVHSAASFQGGLIQLKKAEDLRGVFGPQGRGALELALALEGTPAEHAPDWVVLTSSAVAVTGGLGQVDLAATGAFLDALAGARSARGTSTTALAWGPLAWEDWSLPGAMGAEQVHDELHKSLQEVGITAAEAAEVFRRALAASLPQLVVSPRNLEALKAQTAGATAESLMAQAFSHGEVHRREDLSTPYVEPRNEVEEKLAGIWQTLFGIDRIGVEDSFFELGGHSLLGIQLATHVRRTFGVELAITELFEHPTVASLAGRISEVQAGEELSGDELAKLLEKVEGMSPEEAQRLLSAETEASS